MGDLKRGKSSKKLRWMSLKFDVCLLLKVNVLLIVNMLIMLLILIDIKVWNNMIWKYMVIYFDFFKIENIISFLNLFYNNLLCYLWK